MIFRAAPFLLGTTQDTPWHFVRSNRFIDFDGIMTDVSGNFRSLLLQLSNSLTGRELQGLKFLCQQFLHEYELETINHGFQLFQALEQLGMLSPRDRNFLASKLIAVGRFDLKNKLLGMEG